MPGNFLRKDDLQTNKDYVVTISIKQNNKNIDTLRSFNVKTPKFLDKMNNYTTFSTISKDFYITNQETTQEITPGSTTTTNYFVKDIKIEFIPSWISQYNISRAKSFVKFTITFDDLPSDANKLIDTLTNFQGALSMLNGGSIISQTDTVITQSDKTLSFKISYYDLFDTTQDFVRNTSGTFGIWGDETYKDLILLRYENNTNYASYTSQRKNTWEFAYMTSVKTTAMVYKAATTIQTYNKKLNIDTKILQDSVIANTYWEDDVRDYIYFFISDDFITKDGVKWWWFTDVDSIKPAQPKISMSGNNGYIITRQTVNFENLDPDKLVLGIISDPKSTRPKSASCQFFYGTSNTNADISKNIKVRFAIKRFVKNQNGKWTGSWLGSPNQTSINILSNIEQISGK